MTARPDSSVTAELALRLVVPGSTSLPVAAGVRYDTSDPYALHVAFRTGSTARRWWSGPSPASS